MFFQQYLPSFTKKKIPPSFCRLVWVSPLSPLSMNRTPRGHIRGRSRIPLIRLLFGLYHSPSSPGRESTFKNSPSLTPATWAPISLWPSTYEADGCSDIQGTVRPNHCKVLGSEIISTVSRVGGKKISTSSQYWRSPLWLCVDSPQDSRYYNSLGYYPFSAGHWCSTSLHAWYHRSFTFPRTLLCLRCPTHHCLAQIYSWNGGPPDLWAFIWYCGFTSGFFVCSSV